MFRKLKKMISDARKKPEPIQTCGAEFKLGIQVQRGLKCELPKGHLGRHFANTTAIWPQKPGQPGGKEDL